MTGEERRKGILQFIGDSTVPVSGMTLAKKYQVSRQVVVQDIALIRAEGHEILSTNRGYVMQNPVLATRVVRVSHTDEQIEDELNTIVDLGGRVVDVFITHRVYGFMKAELNLRNRRNVRDFVEGLKSGKSSPLKNLTQSEHCHTIEADSEETLDLIEEELRNKGY